VVQWATAGNGVEPQPSSVEDAIHPVLFSQIGNNGGRLKTLLTTVATADVPAGHGTEVPSMAEALGFLSGSQPAILYAPRVDLHAKPDPRALSIPVGYRLLPITEDPLVSDRPVQSLRGLWDRRRDDRIYGQPHVYPYSDAGGVPDPVSRQYGHGIYGRNRDCKANMPWGWKGGGLEDQDKGQWFLDPAGIFVDKMVKAASGTVKDGPDGRRRYVANVFLRDRPFVVDGGAGLAFPRWQPTGRQACECTTMEENIASGPSRGLDGLAFGDGICQVQ
jgi:hypothetical protein